MKLIMVNLHFDENLKNRQAFLTIYDIFRGFLCQKFLPVELSENIKSEDENSCKTKKSDVYCIII